MSSQEGMRLLLDSLNGCTPPRWWPDTASRSICEASNPAAPFRDPQIVDDLGRTRRDASPSPHAKVRLSEGIHLAKPKLWEFGGVWTWRTAPCGEWRSFRRGLRPDEGRLRGRLICLHG